jgi:hypothetical protein
MIAFHISEMSWHLHSSNIYGLFSHQRYDHHGRRIALPWLQTFEVNVRGIAGMG